MFKLHFFKRNQDKSNYLHDSLPTPPLSLSLSLTRHAHIHTRTHIYVEVGVAESFSLVGVGQRNCYLITIENLVCGKFSNFLNPNTNFFCKKLCKLFGKKIKRLYCTSL